MIAAFKDRAIVWQSPNGRMHFCEGDDIHPGIRLFWTLCGKHDIPADAAWLHRPEDVVDCAECLAVKA